jgi:hypothetical protein
MTCRSKVEIEMEMGTDGFVRECLFAERMEVMMGVDLESVSTNIPWRSAN